MAESPENVRRFEVIDVARGAALAAMVVYHVSWDLAYLRLVDWDVAGDPAWRGFAMAIAATFLAISGASLALSARDGLDGGRFALRLAKVGAAAATVTLATWLMFPDSFVFFGILHMIAAGSVIVAPLLRAPVVVPLALAAVALAMPSFARSAMFDAPPFWPLGLSTVPPVANDYVPLFPWLAPMLLGVAAGRLVATGAVRLPEVKAVGGASRLLAVAGRHSLPIYLVHQPVLFGALFAVAAVVPPDPAAERARFVRDCAAECGTWTADGPYCARFCGCVAGALEGTAFWAVRGGDPEMSSVVATAAATCRSTEPFDPSATPAE